MVPQICKLPIANCTNQMQYYSSSTEVKNEAGRYWKTIIMFSLKIRTWCLQRVRCYLITLGVSKQFSNWGAPASPFLAASTQENEKTSRYFTNHILFLQWNQQNSTFFIFFLKNFFCNCTNKSVCSLSDKSLTWMFGANKLGWSVKNSTILPISCFSNILLSRCIKSQDKIAWSWTSLQQSITL